MIIYRLKINSDADIASAKDLIDSGAKWLMLSVAKDVEGSVLDAISALCKEAEVIMTVEGDMERLESTHCHGIHLLPGTVHPRIVREKLGAEPIVGCTVSTPAEVIALRGADVDYVLISGNEISLEEFASAVHDAKVDIRMVVEVKDNDENHINELLKTGIDGVIY